MLWDDDWDESVFLSQYRDDNIRKSSRSLDSEGCKDAKRRRYTFSINDKETVPKPIHTSTPLQNKGKNCFTPQQSQTVQSKGVSNSATMLEKNGTKRYSLQRMSSTHIAGGKSEWAPPSNQNQNQRRAESALPSNQNQRSAQWTLPSNQKKRSAEWTIPSYQRQSNVGALPSNHLQSAESTHLTNQKRGSAEWSLPSNQNIRSAAKVSTPKITSSTSQKPETKVQVPQVKEHFCSSVCKICPPNKSGINTSRLGSTASATLITSQSLQPNQSVKEKNTVGKNVTFSGNTVYCFTIGTEKMVTITQGETDVHFSILSNETGKNIKLSRFEFYSLFRQFEGMCSIADSILTDMLNAKVKK